MKRRNFLSSTGKVLLVTSTLLVAGKIVTACTDSDDSFNDGYYDDGYYDDGYYDDGYYDDGYYDD